MHPNSRARQIPGPLHGPLDASLRPPHPGARPSRLDIEQSDSKLAPSPDRRPIPSPKSYVSSAQDRVARGGTRVYAERVRRRMSTARHGTRVVSISLPGHSRPIESGLRLDVLLRRFRRELSDRAGCPSLLRLRLLPRTCPCTHRAQDPVSPSGVIAMFKPVIDGLVALALSATRKASLPQPTLVRAVVRSPRVAFGLRRVLQSRSRRTGVRRCGR